MVTIKGDSTIRNLETIKNVDKILGYSEGYFLAQKSYSLESKKEIKEQFDLSNREVNRLLSSQKHSDKYTICWFINKEDGTIVGPFKNARLFSDGVTIVNNDTMAVDTNNNILFTASEKGLEEIGDFKDGISKSVIFSGNLLENYYIYVNKKGNKLHKGRYYVTANDYSEGLAVAEKYGHQCLADRKGSYIYGTKYHLNDYYSEGLISATHRKTFATGYVDTKQRVVIGFIFEEGKPFSEGLAPVKQNGKWGYTNKEGKIVIPCIFEDAEGFKNDLAVVYVKINDQVYPALINKNGDFIIEPNERYSSIKINEDYIIINETRFVQVNDMKLYCQVELTTGETKTLFLFDSLEEKNDFIRLVNKEIEETEEDIKAYKDAAYKDLQHKIFKMKYKKNYK